MKFDMASSRAAALVALIASVDAARHGHHHVHHHEVRSENPILEKKSGQCQFPTDVGLVPITPNALNAGWAMSPNQPCLPGNYCPYACPSGQVMMQWDPQATSYIYPMSMNGGLYCDENGEIQKPFPNKPYCEEGTGAIQAINKAGKPVAFCQTVLPGNEAMIIPTLVEELATLAVPSTSYWCETAAQYYINAPGVSVDEGCVWGTSANPFGNWSPYTAGGNTISDGTTFMKIGWNPIYLEPTTPFRNVRPNFGIEIECEGEGCNGLPCKIDPSSMDVNQMSAFDVFIGAGGATGCVVTVPPGSKANIVVFEIGASDDSSSSEPTSPATSSSTSTPTPTPTPTPTSSETSTETSTSTPTSTPTPTPTPTETETSTETPTPTPTSTSTPTPISSSSSSSSSTSTASLTSTSTATPSSSMLPKSSPSMSYSYRPHVFAPTGAAEISSVAGAAAASASAGTGAATSTTVSMMSVVIGAMAGMFMNF